MAQTNVKTHKRAAPKTAEGAVAMTESPIGVLRRVLMAHMLWEDGFYINGESAADCLTEAVAAAMKVSPSLTATLIFSARWDHNIRHAPLYGAAVYAKLHGPDARGLASVIINRADEMAELLVMAGGRKAPHAVMNGIRDVFESDRFDEYQLGKYKGTGRAMTMLDALRLTHPNPTVNPLVQKVYDGSLAVPNTWETRLSSGEDKKTVFTELLRENRLGAMALLRNLRGMEEVGVDRVLVRTALEKADWSKVLPFRFLSAFLAAPSYAKTLDAAFDRAVAGSDWLAGNTAVLLDTSGSMIAPVSAKSTVNLIQTGAALAAAVNGDHVDLFEWADRTKQVPMTGGLSTAMAMRNGRVGHGTNMGQAIKYVNGLKKIDYDRLIVITDMQFNDVSAPKLLPGQRGYTINLAPNVNAGLMHGDWTHLTGFSQATLRYIAAHEAMD